MENPYVSERNDHVPGDPAHLEICQLRIQFLVASFEFCLGGLWFVWNQYQDAIQYGIPFLQTVQPGVSLFSAVGALTGYSLVFFFLSRLRRFPGLYFAFSMIGPGLKVYDLYSGGSIDETALLSLARITLASYLIFGSCPRTVFSQHTNSGQ